MPSPIDEAGLFRSFATAYPPEKALRVYLAAQLADDEEAERALTAIEGGYYERDLPNGQEVNSRHVIYPCGHPFHD